jgi:two-component system chemotaxis response regulator CheY
VDAAHDGAVAWNTLQLKNYDLLVTDNDMPKVTGVELLKKLHAARMALPVIMATGKLPLHEFTRHPHIEPDAVLLKPYTIDALLHKVQEILGAVTHAREQIATAPDWQSQT